LKTKNLLEDQENTNKGMNQLLRPSSIRKASLFANSRTVKTVPNFINGKFEESKTTKWIDLYNPATQELLCRVPQSTPEELKRAEEGAKEAFKTWKEVPVQQRQVS
jgi:malonate-semialdehyde dehydrogenase (acetylating) / methylmalonate-semialdehyde dehydrogenase